MHQNRRCKIVSGDRNREARSTWYQVCNSAPTCYRRICESAIWSAAYISDFQSCGCSSRLAGSCPRRTTHLNRIPARETQPFAFVLRVTAVHGYPIELSSSILFCCFNLIILKRTHCRSNEENRFAVTSARINSSSEHLCFRSSKFVNEQITISKPTLSRT